MSRLSSLGSPWIVMMGGGGVGMVGIVSASILVGRTRPAEMTVLHIIIFLVVTVSCAGLGLWMWWDKQDTQSVSLVMRSLMPGLFSLIPGCMLYFSDPFNATVQTSFSLRITLCALIPLLLCVGISVTDSWWTTHRGDIPKPRRPLIAIYSLACVVGGVAITDLLLKMSFGDPDSGFVWLIAIGLTAILLLLFRPLLPTTTNESRWGVHLQLLVLPLIFALMSYGDNQLRHLLVTSNGAKLMAACLLILVVYISWLLRPGGDREPRVRLAKYRLVRHRIMLLTGSLLAIGVFQAGSYRVVAMDDLARYWIIADSIVNGLGYPTWEAGPGIAQAAEGGKFVDTPIFPLLIAVSFSVTGHFYHSVQIPIILANIALPGLLFLGLRSAVSRDDIAVAVTLLLVLFPPFQVHLLGAAEPDAVFVLELAAVIWILGRMERCSDIRLRNQMLLGVVLVIVALTRPEGPVYAGVIAFLLPCLCRSWKWSIVPLCVVLGLVLFAVFIAISTDAVWPPQSSGFTIGSIGQNFAFAQGDAFEYYTRVLLVGDVLSLILVLTSLILFLTGVASMLNRKSILIVLPAAMILQLILTFAVAPEGFHRNEPSEMFRHIGYGFPVFGMVVAVGVREILRRSGRILGWLAMAFAVTLIIGELFVLATPEEWYHGNNSGSLLRGGDIYVEAIHLVRNPIIVPCSSCSAPASEVGFDGFRDHLFEHYDEFDMHGDTVGISYAALTGLMSAILLIVVSWLRVDLRNDCEMEPEA